jgi:hypothetical protein
LPFKVFLAATFLTVVLALTEARGAAGPGISLLLEADCDGIGWLCIKTLLKGGEFLQKRTTGAGGRNLKREPSSLIGSGPSCCCKRIGYSCKTFCQSQSDSWASSTCSAEVSASASSWCSSGPRALLKACVFHIDHQISKPSVEEVKDRL